MHTEACRVLAGALGLSVMYLSIARSDFGLNFKVCQILGRLENVLNIFHLWMIFLIIKLETLESLKRVLWVKTLSGANCYYALVSKTCNSNVNVQYAGLLYLFHEKLGKRFGNLHLNLDILLFAYQRQSLTKHLRKVFYICICKPNAWVADQTYQQVVNAHTNKNAENKNAMGSWP